MKKKSLFLITLLISLFTLFVGCSEKEEDEYIILPDLSNMSREEIENVMTKYELDYYFMFDEEKICYIEGDYDQFVKYGSNYKIGDKVNKNNSIVIYTTPLHLNINNLDRAKLTTDYQGKSFIDDGIGQVVLVKSVDGDTARFIDPYSITEKNDFSVRFLGIDTPESTIENEPWGKAASNFTKSRLENAKTIVLEADKDRTDVYGRYLAYVWVDGVLLNLELVQEAYSNAKLSGKSKYFSIMTETSFLAKKTGRRFWGEIDPYFDYSKD